MRDLIHLLIVLWYGHARIVVLWYGHARIVVISSVTC
jgi:hypothetical protein